MFDVLFGSCELLLELHALTQAACSQYALLVHSTQCQCNTQCMYMVGIAHRDKTVCVAFCTYNAMHFINTYIWLDCRGDKLFRHSCQLRCAFHFCIILVPIRKSQLYTYCKQNLDLVNEVSMLLETLTIVLLQTYLKPIMQIVMLINFVFYLYCQNHSSTFIMGLTEFDVNVIVCMFNCHILQVLG